MVGSGATLPASRALPEFALLPPGGLLVPLEMQTVAAPGPGRSGPVEVDARVGIERAERFFAAEQPFVFFVADEPRLGGSIFRIYFLRI